MIFMMLLEEDYWEVKKTEKMGRGVFARKAIKAGTVIGDYIGKVIRTADEDTLEKDNILYLMYYHDRASIYPIDTTAPGVHLLNHSCTPNIWIYTYKGHTLFFALRHIFPGEEMNISYLLSPLDAYCNPCTHLCHCGEAVCIGSMHLSEVRFKKWNAFNEREGKKTKKKRVRYGYELPRLSVYPKVIEDDPIYTLFGSSKVPPEILNDKKLPTVEQLRALLREKGKPLAFPSLKKRVVGIQDDQIILDSI
jgi:hypothetical protein